MSATSNASVPEDTPMPCRHCEYSATSRSSASTSGPRIKRCDSRTRSTASRTSSRIVSYCAFKSSKGTISSPYLVLVLAEVKILLVIPAFNEEPTLPGLIQSARQHLRDIMVIDDG